MPIDISIVVPIYNERETIGLFYDELRAAMEGCGCTWELVYVDDGSRDDSLALLLGLQQRDPRITVLELSRNWGHQPALTAGLSVTRGEAVVLMDGDLQDPPQVLPDLIAAWRRGAQVVIAQRTSRKESGLRKLLFSFFYRVFGYMSDFPIPPNAGIFGLLGRLAVDAINRFSESNRYLPGLRAWIGFPTEVVYYERAARAAGEPKQSLWRLIRYSLDAIFSFSYKPLRLSLLLGILAASGGFVFGLLLIGCRLLGIGLFGLPVVPGYTTTIVSVIVLGGVQLICTGILGEYIGRIYDEVKARPLFLIRTVHKPYV